MSDCVGQRQTDAKADTSTVATIAADADFALLKGDGAVCEMCKKFFASPGYCGLAEVLCIELVVVSSRRNVLG
jgi:hypothetical protein